MDVDENNNAQLSAQVPIESTTAETAEGVEGSANDTSNKINSSDKKKPPRQPNRPAAKKKETTLKIEPGGNEGDPDTIADGEHTQSASKINVLALRKELEKLDLPISATLAELALRGTDIAQQLSRFEDAQSLERRGIPEIFPRPKTHWDYVMDEVQWASVDFRQELRWKRELATSIAGVVLEHGHNFPLRKVNKDKPTILNTLEGMTIPNNIEEIVEVRFKNLEAEIERIKPSHTEEKPTVLTGDSTVQQVIDKVLALSTSAKSSSVDSSSTVTVPSTESTEQSTNDPSFLISHQTSLLREIEKITAMNIGAIVYGSAFSGKSVTVALSLINWIEKAESSSQNSVPIGVILGSRKVLLRWLLIFRKHYSGNSYVNIWTSNVTEGSIPVNKPTVLLVPLEDHKDFHSWVNSFNGKFYCEGIVIDLRAAWIWDRRSGSIPKKSTENIALAFAVQQRSLLMELAQSLPRSKRMVVADDNLRNMDRLSTLAILLPEVSFHALERRFSGNSGTGGGNDAYANNTNKLSAQADQANRNIINQMLINLSAHASIPTEVNARAYAQVREEIIPVDMTPLQQRKYDDICGQIMMNNSTLFTGESVHQLARLSTALKFICFHGKLADRKDLMNPKARAQVEALEGRRNDLVIRSGFLSQTLTNPQEDAALVNDSNKLRALKAQLQRFGGLRVVVVASEWVELHLIHRYLAAEGIPHLCPNLLLQEQMINQLQVNPYKINDDNADLLANWFAEEINTHVFNDKSVLSCVMLATAASFKSPSTTPWLADAIIMLSYDWNQYLDVKNCFRLRLIDAGPSGDPVTVVRLCSKNTIEEVMMKNKASIPALQDRLVGDLNIIPKYPPQHIHQMQIREEFRHLAKTVFLCNAPQLHSGRRTAPMPQSNTGGMPMTGNHPNSLASTQPQHHSLPSQQQQNRYQPQVSSQNQLQHSVITSSVQPQSSTISASNSGSVSNLFGSPAESSSSMEVDGSTPSFNSINNNGGNSASISNTSSTFVSSIGGTIVQPVQVAGRVVVPTMTSGSTLVYPVIPGSGVISTTVSTSTTSMAVSNNATVTPVQPSSSMGMMILGPNGKPQFVKDPRASSATSTDINGSTNIVSNTLPSSSSIVVIPVVPGTSNVASSVGVQKTVVSSVIPPSSSTSYMTGTAATYGISTTPSGVAPLPHSSSIGTMGSATSSAAYTQQNKESAQKWLDIFHNVYHESLMEITFRHTSKYGADSDRPKAREEPTSQSVMRYMAHLAKIATNIIIEQTFYLLNRTSVYLSASSNILQTLHHGAEASIFPSITDGVQAGDDISLFTVGFCNFRVATQRLKDSRVKEKQLQEKSMVSRLQRMRIHAAGVGMSDKERRVNSLFIANITDAMTEHYALKATLPLDGNDNGGTIKPVTISSGSALPNGSMPTFAGVNQPILQNIPVRPGVLQQFRDALHESARVGVQAEPWLYTNPLHTATKYDVISCPSYLKETFDFLHHSHTSKGGGLESSIQISYYDKSSRQPVSYVNFAPLPNPPSSPTPPTPPVQVPAASIEEFVVPVIIINNNGNKDGSGSYAVSNGGIASNAKSRRNNKKIVNNNTNDNNGSAGAGLNGADQAAGKSNAKSNKRQKNNAGNAVSTSAGDGDSNTNGGAMQDGTMYDSQYQPSLEYADGNHDPVSNADPSRVYQTSQSHLHSQLQPHPNSSQHAVMLAQQGQQPHYATSGMLVGGGIKVTSVPVPGSGSTNMPANSNSGSTLPSYGARSSQYVSSYPQQSSVMPSNIYAPSPSSGGNVTGMTSPSSTYPQQSYFTVARSSTTGSTSSGAILSAPTSQNNTPSHPNVKSLTGASNSSVLATNSTANNNLPYGTYQPVNAHNGNAGTNSGTVSNGIGSTTLQQHHSHHNTVHLGHSNISHSAHQSTSHSTLSGGNVGISVAPSSSSSISSLYKTTQQGCLTSTQNVHLYQPPTASGGTSTTTGAAYSYYNPNASGTTSSATFPLSGTSANTNQPVSSYLTSSTSSSIASNTTGSASLLTHSLQSGGNNTIPIGSTGSGVTLTNTHNPSTYLHSSGNSNNSTNSSSTLIATPVPVPCSGGMNSTTLSSSTVMTGSGSNQTGNATLTSGAPWTSLDDDTLIILKQTTYDYQQITACINKLRAQQKSVSRQMQEIVQRYDFLSSTGRVSERLKDQTVINMVAKIQRGATSSIMGSGTNVVNGTNGGSVSTMNVNSTGSGLVSSTGTTFVSTINTNSSSIPYLSTNSTPNSSTVSSANSQLYSAPATNTMAHPVYPATVATGSTNATNPSTASILPSGYVKTVVSTSGSNSSTSMVPSNSIQSVEGTATMISGTSTGNNLYQVHTAPSPSLLHPTNSTTSALNSTTTTTSSLLTGARLTASSPTPLPSGTIVQPVYPNSNNTSLNSATSEFCPLKQQSNTSVVAPPSSSSSTIVQPVSGAVQSINLNNNNSSDLSTASLPPAGTVSGISSSTIVTPVTIPTSSVIATSTAALGGSGSTFVKVVSPSTSQPEPQR